MLWFVLEPLNISVKKDLKDSEVYASLIIDEKTDS